LILETRTRTLPLIVQQSAAALADSWKKTPKGQLSGRGPKLLDPNVPPHPIYAAQELFSLYVHVPPEFEGYSPDSVFYGREITPSTHGERFRHSLGKLSLLLLEAALNDEQVANARFVMISEADAPLYNAAVTYLELMTSAKSRVGPSRDFETILQQDPVCLLLL
jgi:Core-2/I-Branching enzyme